MDGSLALQSFTYIAFPPLARSSHGAWLVIGFGRLRKADRQRDWERKNIAVYLCFLAYGFGWRASCGELIGAIVELSAGKRRIEVFTPLPFRDG